jgi:hypothetical protein
MLSFVIWSIFLDFIDNNKKGVTMKKVPKKSCIGYDFMDNSIIFIFFENQTMKSMKTH